MTTQNDLFTALTAMLVPPGEGVFTYSHALSEREALTRLLYGVNDARSQWLEQLSNLDNTDLPWVIGLPEDTGGGILRGANWGPLFLRLAWYQQSMQRPKLVELGDVRVIPQLLLDDYLNDDLVKSCRAHLYQDAQASYPVSPLSIAFDVLSRLYKAHPNARILGIGGDHSASYPLVKAKLTAAKARQQRMAVLHFDAHTDLLTERMGIPITFGSWVPAVLPLLDSPELWIQIGIRQSGKDKAWWQKSFGLQQYWAAEIKASGVKAVADSIIHHLKEQGADSLYITFDIDSIDGSQVSATGTPETGGMLANEVVELIQRISAVFPVEAADIMEFAPMVHHPEFQQVEPETTLRYILPVYMSLCEALAKGVRSA